MVKRGEHVDSQNSTLEDLIRSGAPYCVVYVSVAGFEQAVESLDEQLSAGLAEIVSQRIKRSVRGGDEAQRVAPGRYVIVINGVSDSDAYRSLQVRIRSALENDVILEGRKVTLSVDFGYASYPMDGSTYEEVVAKAEEAMKRTEHSRERYDELASETSRAEAARIEEGILDHQNLHADALTGLPDALYFRAKATELVADEKVREGNPAIVFCDIEKFKEYNLKYGYSSGDDLLKFLADELVDKFPDTLIARLNSDRFGILTSTDGLVEKLETIHEAVRQFKISSSIEFKAGFCELADCDFSTTKAQDYARLACDSIKGRYDQVWRRFDEGLAVEVRRRQYIVDNLDFAIDQGWIEAYYQPIIRAVTGKVCGMEALSRWNDPEFGMLPPGEFIDVLENAHLIHKLDICMIRRVCSDIRAALDTGRPHPSVSVNLSRLDYQLCDIFTVVDQVVAESGIPKDLLHIEFTETAFTQNAEFFADVLARFHDAGYHVWMDDFGSGYSSLNVLKDFSFDVLKIDMEFLRGLEGSRRTRDIIASVVDMAKKLGIQTLAEGVETEEQYLFLKSIGCEMLQGYLFGKPARIDVMFRLVDEGEMEVENDDVKDYYNAIGRVNMLSPAPFEQAESRESAIEFSSGIPLAVVERIDDEAHMVVANDAFLETAESTGVVDSARDGLISFANRGAKLAAAILDLSDRAKESGKDEYVDFYNFKELYTIRLLHLAECGERDAYLVSLSSYETTAEQARMQPHREKASSMVYLPERQVTPWQQSDEIDLDHTAIIVIDVLGGAEGVTPGLEDMASNSVDIVKAARAAGMPIIFNIDSHIKGLDRELELWGDHGVRGTPSGTPIVEFEMADTDYVIPKRRYNGFFETDLELTLRELGVTTLIMVGADTNICVLQTLAGAYFYGYKTVVPADAVATFLIGTQESGLEYFSRCYDTRIVTTASILKRIEEKK